MFPFPSCERHLPPPPRTPSYSSLHVLQLSIITAFSSISEHVSQNPLNSPSPNLLILLYGILPDFFLTSVSPLSYDLKPSDLRVRQRFHMTRRNCVFSRKPNKNEAAGDLGQACPW